jgi:Actin-like ATPase involved in cell morphogenesis
MHTIIAVDHGNDSIKTRNHHFKTCLTEHLVRPPIETEFIKYGNKYYTCSGERIPYMRDKTKDERFFILTLFAIAKELKLNGNIHVLNSVDLAVGLPPEHFGKQRNHFGNYFQHGNIISFVYRDIPVSINIHSVSVFTQAHAAVAPRIGTLKKAAQTFIIDIGGYTTDVLLLRNGRVDINYCRSLEIGIITMNNELIGKVNSMHDMMIDDTHTMAVLNDEPTILPAQVQDTIRTAAKQHAQHILDKLRELKVDLRSNPAVFIGGGSILLRPYISNSTQVSSPDFVDDVKANAIGYEMLLSAKLGSTSV